VRRALLGLLVAGCRWYTSSSSEPEPDAAWVAGNVTTTYEASSFSVTPANQIAFNLDGDDEDRVDDALAGAITFIDTDGSLIMDPLTGGPTKLDFRVQSDGQLADPHVFFTAVGGDGCWGNLDAAGHVEAGGGCTIPLSIFIGDLPPLELDLVGGMVSVWMDQTGCIGKLGGGITTQAIHDTIEPWFAQLLDERIGETCDPAGGCVANDACRTDLDACDDRAYYLRTSFDKPETGCDPAICVSDGTINVDEVRANVWTQTLLAPDLDLLDANGAYAPVPITDPTAMPDVLSFGLSFTCAAQPLP
jgi:hypothetical protein